VRIWLAVFFGCLGCAGGLIFVIWLNVQVYNAFGDTASAVAVLVTLSAVLATVVTALRKLFE
jgi:hypothetical protein